MAVVGSVLTAISLPDIPFIEQGADLVEVIAAALVRADVVLADGDVVVVTSKVVARAEGRLRRLDDVIASARAQALGAEVGSDPRLVELVLAESTAVSRQKPGALIVRHRLGLVCANAGIDRSNVGPDVGSEAVLLLPVDPDRSAERLRAGLAARGSAARFSVVLSDSHCRAFRRGSVGIAIGVAGMAAVDDMRGRCDLHGRVLEHTMTALADQVAAVADLVAGQADEARPVVVVRGLRPSAPGGCARDLLRPVDEDLYA